MKNGKHFVLPILIFTLAAALSCSNGNKIMERLDYIKAVGDTNPRLASLMLDTINGRVRRALEPVNMKYDLLRIRLNDKAYLVATSDSMIKILLDYYERHGNDREKQEAYYYAGSVYRDLNDTPRSLEYFLKAEETAENGKNCDSLMLRNTYSNLFLLYKGSMLDNKNAYTCVRKEYEISKKLGKTELVCLLHMGESLISLDSAEQGRRMYVHVLDSIYSDPQIGGSVYRLRKLQNDIHLLNNILWTLSFLNDSDNAKRCINLIEKAGIGDDDALICCAYGYYYNMLDKKDSSLMAFERSVSIEKNMMTKCATAGTLFKMYDRQGMNDKAVKYARQYVKLNDSLNLDERQREAFRTHNMFQYHLDKSKEEKIMRDQATMKLGMAIVCSLCAVVLILVFIYIRNKSTRSAKEVEAISNERDRQAGMVNKLQADLATSTKEAATIKERLGENESDITTYKTELAQKQQELDQATMMVKEKTVQNASLLAMIRQWRQNDLPGDLEQILQMNNPKVYNISKEQWKVIYQEIDKTHPEVMNLILEKIGRVNETQLRIIYLLCMDIPKRQIERLTGASHSTVMRWSKKFQGLFGDSLKTQQGK